jgi:hypothetical protein
MLVRRMLDVKGNFEKTAPDKARRREDFRKGLAQFVTLTVEASLNGKKAPPLQVSFPFSDLTITRLRAALEHGQDFRRKQTVVSVDLPMAGHDAADFADAVQYAQHAVQDRLTLLGKQPTRDFGQSAVVAAYRVLLEFQFQATADDRLTVSCNLLRLAAAGNGMMDDMVSGKGMDEASGEFARSLRRLIPVSQVLTREKIKADFEADGR